MRQFSLNTEKLVKWLVPSQLGAVVKALIKVLVAEVKKGFELIYGKIQDVFPVHWLFYVQPPNNYLITTWQRIQRTWRVNSSVLIYRVACSALLERVYATALTGRYIINHESIPGYTFTNGDWLAWWDEEEKFLRLQENIGIDGWHDSLLILRDGLVLSATRALKITEQSISTQLSPTTRISEGSGLAAVRISEREAEADVTFRFNKELWTFAIPDGGSYSYEYVGDEEIKRIYNKVLAGMKPFQQLGRTFNFEAK